MKLIGKRIRLHGRHFPRAHIIAEMKGRGGEPLLLCATWSARKQWWTYEVIFGDLIESYEVTP